MHCRPMQGVWASAMFPHSLLFSAKLVAKSSLISLFLLLCCEQEAKLLLVFVIFESISGHPWALLLGAGDSDPVLPDPSNVCQVVPQLLSNFHWEIGTGGTTKFSHVGERHCPAQSLCLSAKCRYLKGGMLPQLLAVSSSPSFFHTLSYTLQHS